MFLTYRLTRSGTDNVVSVAANVCQEDVQNDALLFFRNTNDERGLNASTQELQGRTDLTNAVATGRKTCGVRVKFVRVKSGCATVFVWPFVSHSFRTEEVLKSNKFTMLFCKHRLQEDRRSRC